MGSAAKFCCTERRAAVVAMGLALWPGMDASDESEDGAGLGLVDAAPFSTVDISVRRRRAMVELPK